MPRHISYEGRTIEVPDDASDDFISQVLASPSTGGGDPSKGAGTKPKPKSVSQRVNDYADSKFANNDVPGSEVMRPIGNVGRRAVRDVVHGATDFADRITSPSKWGSATPEEINSAPSPLVERVKEFGSTARDKGVVQAGTDLGGDALALELTRGTAERIPGALNKGGNMLKKGGAVTSRFAAGMESPTSPDVYGADPGAALSENHIVGTSPKSLRSRVNAHIQPATEARNAVLDASTAAPVDISADVRAPFDKATAAKTHPKTGAATPGQIQKTTLARRVISEEVDPESGIPSGTPKDARLKPREISDLGANVYGMTDYTTPENSVANGALKEAGAALKDRLTQVAPESAPLTRNVHNLLEAEDELKAKVQSPQMPDHTLFSGTAKGILNRAVTGAGTGAGALLDMAGNTMKGAGGALRRLGSSPSSSPTAPVRPTPPPGTGLPSGGPSSGTGLPGGAPAAPVVPSTPLPPGATSPGLPGAASPSSPPLPPTGIPHPGEVGPGARNRTAPLSSRMRNQQVAPDQPGYISPVAPASPTMKVGPDGTAVPVRPGLPAPPSTPRLGTSADNTRSARRPLLDQLRADAEAHATSHAASIDASKAKLAGVPEARPGSVEPPPVVPSTPPKPASPPKGARKTLSSRVKGAAPAPESGQPTPGPSDPAFRLPAKNDMEGWMGLMDKGWAEYDAKRAEFTYTGPTNLSSRVKGTGK